LAASAVNEIADQVWDEILSGHAGVGSTGAALSAAGGSGDPWSTAVPGAYGAGTAGHTLGTYIDAAVSSRMATYTQPTGFLAATFPGTVASTTNITAGTITTTTNLTNLPPITADWITAAGIAADAITEIQSGLATASSLATVAGYLDTEIQQILTNIAALNNLSAAQVNAQLLDVLTTDTFAELGAVPAATSSLKDKLTYIFMWMRNKSTQTATTRLLRNDADSATVATETVSDDGTTYTKGEAV
jgi:ethanolamine utilization protein EutA (predicted chaperonin)